MKNETCGSCAEALSRHRPSNGCPYNGWVNYETWLVALWLDNEQGSYEEVRHMTKADQIKDYVEQLISFNTGGDGDDWPKGIAGDLITSAMQEVEWRDILAHYEDE